MFFFHAAHQIGGIADLRFDFFLAVAEIVVGDDRDDHSRFIAARDFERITVVIEFIFAFPAHAVVSLAIGGLTDMRQPDVFLRQLGQMRCQDHATGMSRPVFDIESRIVHGHERVTGVAEDRFHEVQIADQRPWCEEADFHRLFRTISRYCGADDGTQQHRDPVPGFLFLICRERQQQQIGGRIHRMTEQRHVGLLGYGTFVTGDRHTAFADVKCSNGGASVGSRIMEDAVAHAIRMQILAIDLVAISGQRQFARQTMSVTDQGSARNSQLVWGRSFVTGGSRSGQATSIRIGGFLSQDIGKVRIQERFDSLIDGTPMVIK